MAQTLTRAVHSEIVIRKSRFLGCVEPMGGREAALLRVAHLKAEHPGANHVCWALKAGGQSAANDDGEPGGTAGRPMLEVLRHHDLEGVLATVVRHFGGIKLGAGGLVRAYTDAVATALLQAREEHLFKLQESLVTLECAVPYALEGWLRRELELHQADLLQAGHGSVVTLTFTVPQSQVAHVQHRLNQGGQGRLVWLSNGHNTGLT